MLTQKDKKKAFTLIELLVVIAIIGVLATVSVIALSNARAKSRDAKRVGNMKQTQTALELFFNDNGRYPTEEEWNTGTLLSTTSSATTTYMKVIPTAPIPADGDCSENENVLTYAQTENGASYSISFCIGNTTGTIAPGNKFLIPAGIISVGEEDGGDEEPLPSPFDCGTETVNDADGNTYNTILIGSQCWMAENLKTTKYNDGSSIDYPGGDNNAWVTNNTGAYSWYDNNIAYKNVYGALYNWYAVNTNNLCPEDWGVPSDTNWKTLEIYLGMTQNQADSLGFRGNDEGSKIAGSYELWQSVEEFWDGSQLVDNANFGVSNFNGVPGGLRSPYDGSFTLLYGYGTWWSSSTSPTPNYPFQRSIEYPYAWIYRGDSHINQGLSVRCLRI